MTKRIETRAETIVGLRETVAPAEISEFFGRALGIAAERIVAAGGTILGPPTAVYQGHGPERFDVLAGFPVAMPADRATTGLDSVSLPAGPALEHLHEGAYDTLVQGYDALTTEIEARSTPLPELMWEKYLVGPESSSNTSDWRTQIVFPLPAGAA